jgi:hypothetical protein
VYYQTRFHPFSGRIGRGFNTVIPLGSLFRVLLEPILYMGGALVVGLLIGVVIARLRRRWLRAQVSKRGGRHVWRRVAFGVLGLVLLAASYGLLNLAWSIFYPLVENFVPPGEGVDEGTPIILTVGSLVWLMQVFFAGVCGLMSLGLGLGGIGSLLMAVVPDTLPASVARLMKRAGRGETTDGGSDRQICSRCHVSVAWKPERTVCPRCGSPWEPLQG